MPLGAGLGLRQGEVFGLAVNDVTITALSEYLGHADPGFTLKVYTHLMPSSKQRTRKAIDAVFGDPDGPDQPVAA